jgi:cellulose synthase/poly-beta-1,6-N-acetylglucosamine synthase-like glycosyltransferase
MILADTTAAGAWVLWGLYALVVLLWLRGYVELERAVRTWLLTPASAADLPPHPPRISVIVAAHNEAGSIGACLEHIAAQGYPGLDIVVANDRSTDETGAIVRDFARTQSGVRLVEIDALPAGWLGKAHALSAAAREVGGDLLVFTDADVVWQPGLLAAVTRLIEREQLDVASLWPRVRVASFWEGLLLPACGWVLALWFRPRPARRGDDRPALANGQFIAIRRAAYEQIGGFDTVRDELAEDVALMRRAQAAGLRRYMGFGRDLLTTRMAENVGQIIAGWTRIFAGALGARWRMLASILALAVGVWSAFIALAVLAIGLVHGSPWGVLHTAWFTAAGVHLAVMYTLFRRHLALGFEGRTYLPLFPLGLIGAALLLVRSVLVSSGFGTVAWGGVRYRVRGSRAVGRR